jgi:hypothetical protein
MIHAKRKQDSNIISRTVAFAFSRGMVQVVIFCPPVRWTEAQTKMGQITIQTAHEVPPS